MYRAAVAAALLLASSLSFAADEPPGASSCSGCHAVKSGVQTPIPPLNGRDAKEIAAAMAEFRSGARPSTVMDRIAKGYTAEETQAIAGWLATQPQPN
jgi:sulfide dehydrogenase cytochrome subunit